MKKYELDQIKKVSKDLQDFLPAIEEGFKQYSEGKVVVPPVGHMHMAKPEGNLHLKYCHIPSEEHFVVKLASHFPENFQKGLNSIDGMMILFSQKTGEPLVLFQDRGYMSQLRTGIAGAIMAKYLAPKKVERIGIIGAGTQARFQLKTLKGIVDCNEVIVWARDVEQANRYAHDKELEGFRISVARSLEELTNSCNLIVTTTPSRKAILEEGMIRPGTHITAVGADSPGKQELDPGILKKADLIVVDSRSQCADHGETFYAISQGLISPTGVYEIGEVITGKAPRRTNDSQITIADLTGLAVQDLKIAEAIYRLLT